MLRKSPGFAAVAVLTLALGIGANTAIFSVVDAVLLRSLPYANPNRLTVIWQSDPEHMDTGGWFNTYDEFQAWDRSSRTFEKLAAFTWASGGATLSWHGERRHIAAMPVTVDFFKILGVRPVDGRTFESNDLDHACTVVLARGFWKTRLGGAPGMVGTELTLDDQSCVVVGIMPEDFSFYPRQVQAWTLITHESDFVRDPVHAMVGVSRPSQAWNYARQRAIRTRFAPVAYRVAFAGPCRISPATRRFGSSAGIHLAYRTQSALECDHSFRLGSLRAIDRLPQRRRPATGSRFAAPEGICCAHGARLFALSRCSLAGH